ncbi:MAG: YceD family protein [Longimicrobiaceae bacterium]
MLTLSLAGLAREGEARLSGDIPPHHAVWSGVEAEPAAPARLELQAREAGEGVLVRGKIRASFRLPCRRCLAGLEVELEDDLNIFFEYEESWREDGPESDTFPLPEGAREIDLTGPIREHLLLAAPTFALCDERCKGLCPRCGADLNRGECGCEPEPQGGAWDKLKQVTLEE